MRAFFLREDFFFLPVLAPDERFLAPLRTPTFFLDLVLFVALPLLLTLDFFLDEPADLELFLLVLLAMTCFLSIVNNE